MRIPQSKDRAKALLLVTILSLASFGVTLLAGHPEELTPSTTMDRLRLT